MKEEMKGNNTGDLPDFTLSDEDIVKAMKDIPGYLDITPGDLKEIFLHAYRHAVERIANSATVRDIMTAEVYYAYRHTPLQEVAFLMMEKNISGLPVVDEDRKAVGVISEKDFLSRMGGGKSMHVMAVIAECLKDSGRLAESVRNGKAEDIMTSPAITVSEDFTVFRTMGLFSSKGINRAPVVDNAGRLEGIVSRADLIRARIFGRE